MRGNVFLKDSLISKKYVSSFVSSISNDDMINGLINDLINRTGVTNFFWTDSGFYYSLRGVNGEFLGFIADNNSFYVSNNMDEICQQISCVKNIDGVSICIDNRSKIDIHNNSLYRNVKYEKRYDCSSNIIFDSKIVETCDSNNDPDENCCSIISRFYFGDEIIKVHSMSYSLKPYLNSVKYFVIRDDNQLSIDSDEFDRLSCLAKILKK